MDAWFDALDAYEGPAAETVAALSAVIEAGFIETQALVHVVTGSLKNSGRTEFQESPGEWRGAIVYGGPSPGFPNDPVRYAKEEFGRGWEHDALRNTDLMHHDLFEALYASVKSKLRG